MKLNEMFRKCEKGNDVCEMIDDYEVFMRQVTDPQVPHKYIMWVTDTNTGEEDFMFFDSILEVNRVFQILTKSI